MEGDIVPCHGSDQHDAPLLRQDRCAGGEIGTADQVEYDIETATASFRLCELVELAEGDIHHASGFETILLRALDLVLRARSSVGNSAESAHDLHSGQADTAADRMDQHTLAKLHVSLRDQ